MATSEAWVTIPEAAEHVGVSPRALYRWINIGLVEGRRVGPKLVQVNLRSVEAQVTPIGKPK